jgi:glutathione synthase/RimK-type ligase-like ATP-grasp enzyme
VSKKPFVFNFLEKLNYRRILMNNTNPLELVERLNISKKGNSITRPKVLILTKKIDIESDLLGIQFLKNGIDYIKITEEDIPLNFRFEFKVGKFNDSILWLRNRKVIPDEIKIVLFRYFDLKFLSFYPVGIYQMYFAQQWYQAFNCIAVAIDSLWVNNPQRTFEAENRLNQLLWAQKIGFSIPETLITNEMAAAKKFFKTFRKSTIVKVLHHHEIYLNQRSFRFLTNNIETSHISKFDELTYAPVIFQKKINNSSEIRVTVVNDRIFSCRISTTQEKHNFSDLHKIKENDLIFSEISIGKKIEKLCINLNTKLGLLVSSIDFIEGKNGELFFLEINPIGDWNWIEKHTNLPVTKSVFDFVNGFLNKHQST